MANGLAVRILHPLLPHIVGCETWLISPDASLWLVPWSALPLPSGKYAVEDHAIRYLVSGRELATGAVSIRTAPLVLLADPDYDLTAPRARSLPATSFGFRLAVHTLAVRLAVIKASTGTCTRGQSLPGSLSLPVTAS